MNFKNVKKHKRKDNIKGSWKLELLDAERKEKRKDILKTDDLVVKRPPAKKKWPCKRGKGEHIFELVPKDNKFNWLEYKCKNCGKIEVRFWHHKMFKNVDGYFEEVELDACFKCKKKVVPDLEAVDKKGLWDGHTFKQACNCLNNKDIRISIG